VAGNLLCSPSTLCRHIGLLFGERLDTLFFNFEPVKINCLSLFTTVPCEQGLSGSRLIIVIVIMYHVVIIVFKYHEGRGHLVVD